MIDEQFNQVDWLTRTVNRQDALIERLTRRIEALEKKLNDYKVVPFFVDDDEQMTEWPSSEAEDRMTYRRAG